MRIETASLIVFPRIARSVADTLVWQCRCQALSFGPDINGIGCNGYHVLKHEGRGDLRNQAAEAEDKIVRFPRWLPSPKMYPVRPSADSVTRNTEIE